MPLTERQAQEKVLYGLFGEPELEKKQDRPEHTYEAIRREIREQVAATRPRSAKITGATDINSLLGDIGPGLWKSINPSYFTANDKLLKCTSHTVHSYNAAEGWAEPIDRTHFLKMADCQQFADKCLRIGEKPFLGSGMKLNGKPAS